MPHLARRLAVLASLVVVCGGISLRGQDPDGGAGRGRPLLAHRPSVPGIHGLVTAGHPLAAMAGMQVLLKGGNAIDAAVAIGAALNMMEPQMNGIGGNGFMTGEEKKRGEGYSLAVGGAAPEGGKKGEETPGKVEWGVNARSGPGQFGGVPPPPR